MLYPLAEPDPTPLSDRVSYHFFEEKGETDPVIKLTHFCVVKPTKNRMSWRVELDYTPYKIMPPDVFMKFVISGFPNRHYAALMGVSDGVGCVTEEQLDALIKRRNRLYDAI